MLDEERPVRRQTLLSTSLCCLWSYAGDALPSRLRTLLGVVARRELGCQCYEPPAQRKANTLLDLQRDYGTAMLKYRCGMLHRRRACRPSGVCIFAAAKCSRCRCKCRGSPAAKDLRRLPVAPAWRDLAGMASVGEQRPYAIQRVDLGWSGRYWYLT